MAAKTGLTHVVENDGSVSIGVTLNGRYVPIASQPANIVRHYTEDVPADDDQSGEPDAKDGE